MDDEEREEAGGRDEQPLVGKSKPVVVSTVEEGDDDDDETWMMVKSRAVAESGAETAWQIRRDKRVQFAAAAAQWHERQRRAEEFDLRTGKVCGKGYEGDEPVTVDENGTIIDSGTTLLLFPEPVVDSLYYTIEDGCAESDCLLTLQNQTTCSGPTSVSESRSSSRIHTSVWSCHAGSATSLVP